MNFNFETFITLVFVLCVYFSSTILLLLCLLIFYRYLKSFKKEEEEEANTASIDLLFCFIIDWIFCCGWSILIKVKITLSQDHSSYTLLKNSKKTRKNECKHFISTNSGHFFCEKRNAKKGKPFKIKTKRRASSSLCFLSTNNSSSLFFLLFSWLEFLLEIEILLRQKNLI